MDTSIRHDRYLVCDDLEGFVQFAPLGVLPNEKERCTGRKLELAAAVEFQSALEAFLMVGRGRDKKLVDETHGIGPAILGRGEELWK